MASRWNHSEESRRFVNWFWRMSSLVIFSYWSCSTPIAWNDRTTLWWCMIYWNSHESSVELHESNLPGRLASLRTELSRLGKVGPDKYWSSLAKRCKVCKEWKWWKKRMHRFNYAIFSHGGFLTLQCMTMTCLLVVTFAASVLFMFVLGF